MTPSPTQLSKGQPPAKSCLKNQISFLGTGGEGPDLLPSAHIFESRPFLGAAPPFCCGVRLSMGSGRASSTSISSQLNWRQAGRWSQYFCTTVRRRTIFNATKVFQSFKSCFWSVVVISLGLGRQSHSPRHSLRGLEVGERGTSAEVQSGRFLSSRQKCPTAMHSGTTYQKK